MGPSHGACGRGDVCCAARDRDLVARSRSVRCRGQPSRPRSFVAGREGCARRPRHEPRGLAGRGRNGPQPCRGHAGSVERELHLQRTGPGREPDPLRGHRRRVHRHRLLRLPAGSPHRRGGDLSAVVDKRHNRRRRLHRRRNRDNERRWQLYGHLCRSKSVRRGQSRCRLPSHCGAGERGVPAVRSGGHRRHRRQPHCARLLGVVTVARPGPTSGPPCAGRGHGGDGRRERVLDRNLGRRRVLLRRRRLLRLDGGSAPERPDHAHREHAGRQGLLARGR